MWAGQPTHFRASAFAELSVPSSASDGLRAVSKSDLARIFYGHEGRTAHKWLHYLDIYERHLHQYRGTDFKFLEIGVSEGGSLEVWRKYFGSEATIFGIDINADCATRVTAPNQVRIGSQDDRDFLHNVVQEMGGIDVVLDDGSHIGSHQAMSFAVLFPLLREGGSYIIEDLHTAYWPGAHRGGLKRRGSAIELVKEMIDDMHRWYHTQKRPSHGPIGAVHVYDSIAIIEKRTAPRPGHIRVPAETRTV
jgi:hypothetical protein